MWAAVVIAAAFGLYAAMAALTRLRELHGDTWTSLGSPAQWNPSTSDASWDAFHRFVLSNRHKSLADPVLDRLVLRAKGAAVAMLILGFCAIVVSLN